MSEEQLYEEMSKDLAEIEEERIRQIRQEAAKECVAMILQGSSLVPKKISFKR